MITLGFVIDVPEPYAARIREARRGWGDIGAGSIPAHITIVPPVSVDAEEMPVLEQHLERALLGCAPFRMRLRGTGTFRPVSPVVFLTVAEGISGCEGLEQRIRCGPWAVDLRFPYHPHVTVAFDLPDEGLDHASTVLGDFEADFTVDAVRLYELVDGDWVARATYPLLG
jgi:2'-5' RNA ligase